MTFLRKLCYKVLIWNIYIFFLKAKLNAWNDSKLVLLKKILHHEWGRQIEIILTILWGRTQICTNKFYFYGYVKSCFQAYRHEF